LSKELLSTLTPGWDCGPRRLCLQPLSTQGDDISSKYDHINPRSWQGNVKVKDVILQTCWIEGRKLAESELQESQMELSFEMMEAAGGFDILCPLGKDKLLLLELPKEASDGDDPDEVGDTGAVPAEEPFQPASEDLYLDIPRDLEDYVNDLRDENLPHGPQPVNKGKDWVELEDGTLMHKATVCRIFSDPFAVHNSNDRLKRVQHLSRFNGTSPDAVDLPIEPNLDDPILHVEDPAATLFVCSSRTFLGIVQITSITDDGKGVDYIPVKRLAYPHTCVTI
jgi:hypothetical protein